MRVLVACECSGIVRDAFARRGHDAWSCDLQPTERPGQHIQGDAITAAYRGCPVTYSGSNRNEAHDLYHPWDLMIAHPDCTFLANSGAKHLYAGMKKENGPDPTRWARMGAAAFFFLTLWRAPIARKCIENPVMLGHPKGLFGIPRPAQTIQPWQFGHGETKATCLWLDGLLPLRPTAIVDGREQRVFRMAPGPERKRDRSRTFEGIAEAMADQWSSGILEANQDRKAA